MTHGITDSTGRFGSAAISHLLKKGIDPSSIVAVARNKEKAEKLTASGISIGIADYAGAAACVLMGENLSNSTYELTGNPGISMIWRKQLVSFTTKRSVIIQ